MDNETEVIPRSSALEQALRDLNHTTERLGAMTSQVENRLVDLLNVHTPVECREDDPDAPAHSTHVEAIIAATRHIDGTIARYEQLLQRLEV